MSQPVLPVSAIDFLNDLKNNNNREWFTAHKEFYQQQLGFVEGFVDAILANLNLHDVIETPTGKKSMHRIYRDTRFGKDKTPYKTNWSGSFRRATKYRRGGYYYHFEPGNTFIACGFWAPNPPDLKRIRDDIAFDDKPLRKIINSPVFIKSFGTLRGETVKTTPKGYPPDHEAIDLLRYKQYLVVHRFTDEEFLSAGFFESVCQALRDMRPFLDYMSEVLVTDINGMVD
ncbi:DUF2461 domain-containing protein [Mucilaginibacter ginsenosidivorax]|uniref:DUF2461 domain-containing protein n=1 Tax=Mucilaginibacter ginsenosidivorax TaxID=862126 RepID=A0A5B8VZU3_9SPHI|nr:DUF2461 domain-containing protein [Mucilaginibacter ginsenosidivorax]QEC77054.1 DUF2461 domain-containing protein [Mucilaginibacter ginsenosidivorax]